MFDKIIVDILNSKLQAFIENLDPNQLGSSLLKGSLTLENLQLKTSLFNDSPLPFLLQAGQVGKIALKIPFWNLKT
jgi:hypothetical protein